MRKRIKSHISQLCVVKKPKYSFLTECQPRRFISDASLCHGFWRMKCQNAGTQVGLKIRWMTESKKKVSSLRTMQPFYDYENFFAAALSSILSWGGVP